MRALRRRSTCGVTGSTARRGNQRGHFIQLLAAMDANLECSGLEWTRLGRISPRAVASSSLGSVNFSASTDPKHWLLRALPRLSAPPSRISLRKPQLWLEADG
jgi:hypothetical protein